ncbi:MAG: pyridoxamine 5'-phosphate oxidase family protein [Rhodobacteraceae bacterium]|uniref:Flavin-nucleotide-binding protein n=1 Tax=Thioclava marina TaxID=1915077 RepID=A0ABX3MNP4_9RHOB|nr:pyridoxamine 5'-phosphate oxidase family protein [Thioclava marina]OOY13161.1 flavin-nucleotide-binding protein [Thioclava marina]TNF12245.1 MAG: pyridoxamine 5'-phosphate oxidase family protein [Paracoccaceae bacterium]
MTDTLPVTERSRLRRLHERGHFDRDTINAILDAQPMCHVGYVMEGRPYVTPTLQWREGNHVYWHGSSASRALRAQKEAEVCLTVSILDGFVLARSGMHHSLNTRSVMLFGTAFKVEDPEEKLTKLGNFVNQLYPGRYETLRPDHAQDLKATTVMGMEISEGAAKLRAGGPKDEDEDYALPIWAGEIPVRMVVGEPIPDPRNLEGVEMPDHVRDFRYL